MKKVFLLLGLTIFGLLTSIEMQANHLVGGELSYSCLGGNIYEISLTIYRDCDPNAPVNSADFDDPATIFVLDNTGAEIQTLSLAHDPNGDTPIPANLDGICGTSIPEICVEYFVYTSTITLSPLAGGYDLVYQRCCRNSGITNLVLPNETGSTYILHIPHETPNCDNSAPAFNNLPPLILCQGAPFNFDYSATDEDGDLLVYELCDPLDGASVTAPLPTNLADLTPFAPVNWAAGYNNVDQLGATSTISIDSATGLLLMQPADLGKFVVGICITEFRDGIILSQKVRDYQFTVVPCEVVIANAGPDVELCEPAPIQLEGDSFGENISVSWEPAGELDDANILNPTVANPVDGMVFTITIDNGDGCMDSDTMTITITSSSDSDPGTMSAGPVIVCAGGTVSASSSGSTIASGDALAYYLHTGSGSAAGDILDSNLTGVFSQVTGVQSNTTYYISAVVGPDDGNGFPDLTSDCVVVAPGTPVVFLNPLVIGIDPFCDNSEGLFSVSIFAEGGLPEYDSNASYSFSGIANVSLSFGQSAEIALGAFDGQTYAVGAIDALSCSDNFESDPVTCVKESAIALNEFYGKRENLSAQLFWSTLSETENSFFRIERSREGEQWEVAGIIQGAGYSYDLINYNFQDTELGVGSAFYRIASVDLSGNAEYSHVIYILSNESEGNEQIMTIAPNPTNEFLVIQVDEGITGEWQYRMYDCQGKLVKRGFVTNGQLLSVGELNTGIYLLEVENGLNNSKTRIVKN